MGTHKKGLIERILGSSFPILFMLMTLVTGVLALYVMPREEDPQIIVPMADILISAPGISAQQISRQVTQPLEQLVSQIDGVEYVYSQSQRDGALITVRFYVGESRTDSLVKLYNKLYANQDQVPAMVHSWAIKPVEIDDVPIVVAAFVSQDEHKYNTYELRRIAEESVHKLKSIAKTNQVQIVGGQPRKLLIELDSLALAAHRVSLVDVAQAIQEANQQHTAGVLFESGLQLSVETGQFLNRVTDFEEIVVRVHEGQPVYLKDVARIKDGPDRAEQYTFYYEGMASEKFEQGTLGKPAVFVSVAKQKGSNAVWVAEDTVKALKAIKADWLPDEIDIEIIRNYGETADEKVTELVSSLLVAIFVVVITIGIFLSWRAAAVVALAIPVSYGATLGMDLLFGYTINRVTLFALLLALGLIVDDPIAAIDNIERHTRLAGKKTKQAIVLGMVEIRSALLMSTLAIIVVFLPMFFITGMMGPYMAPMAFNVPVAVIFSTLTAFFVTPWLAWKIMRVAESKKQYNPQSTLLYRGYQALLGYFLASNQRSKLFLWAVFGMFLVAAALPAFRLVPLKLLPHDNKPEFQIVVDMPQGTSAETTAKTMYQLVQSLQAVPEIKSISTFVGLASPMDFNGMVRHYFRRGESHQAEARVVLVDKQARNYQSNELVSALREPLERQAKSLGVHRIEIVQVPPGPPVMSTLVAEVYGNEFTAYEQLEQAAERVAQRLSQEAHVSQVATSTPTEHQVYRFEIDQEKAALSGVPLNQIHQTLASATQGSVLGYFQQPKENQPLPIELKLPKMQRGQLEPLLSLQVESLQVESQHKTAHAMPAVALMDLGQFKLKTEDTPIYHKNLKPVVYVYGEVTGRVPADVVIDMQADQGKSHQQPRGLSKRTYFSNGSGLGWDIVDLGEEISVVWSGEGEWKITLDVFRDLGIAYLISLLGVYVIMVLQTGLKGVSGIMMLSIPLTIIGIMPGFWFLNIFSQDISGYPNPTLFTATAMIGMIALAGIVVRNALILIEFIQQRLELGIELKEALYEAGAARTRPILLTAGTTLLANIVITLDPIFNGLAWSIIFGIAASTVFTLIVIPVVYHLMYQNTPGYGLKIEPNDSND